MPPSLLAFIGLVMPVAAAAPSPLLLQIVREQLKPGSEVAFSKIEEERAHLSATLGCPHPYLGAESLTGPKEAWWFNAYASSAEQQQVYDAYAKNTALLAALQRSAGPKARLALDPIETIATYRPQLSDGPQWRVGHGRYLVITATKTNDRIAGTVFEAPDGTRFIVSSTRTRREAEAARALAGSESNIFAVRPTWSFPSRDWIAADAVFWRKSAAVTGTAKAQ